MVGLKAEVFVLLITMLITLSLQQALQPLSLSRPLSPISQPPLTTPSLMPLQSCFIDCASSLCSKFDHDKRRHRGCVSLCSKTCSQQKVNFGNFPCIFTCSLDKCMPYLSDLFKLGGCVEDCNTGCMGSSPSEPSPP